MLVLACVVIGVLASRLVCGRFPTIDALDLRRGGLVFAALALQLLIFTPAVAAVPRVAIVPAHIVSYALVGAFLLCNWRRLELLLLGLGFLANAVVIALNDGRMPISLEAWAATGRPAHLLTATGTSNNNVLATPHTHLAWLGDVFALPRAVPLANTLSVGDLLIVAGGFLLLLSAGKRARRTPARLIRPMANPKFRQLTIARFASQAGDWITIAATVTWLYTHTHSTVWLSAFMIIRIGALALGGIAAAPLLGHATTRTLALLCLGRGALTLIALVLAAHGDMIATLALLAASAALATPGAATTSALIPRVVAEGDLHAANALSAFFGEVAMVAGTAAASLLASYYSFSAALAIDAATFAAATTVFLRLRIEPMPTTPTVDDRGQNTKPPALPVVLRSRTVMALLGSFALTTTAIGILNSSLPRFLADHAGNGHAYGYAMAAIGAGALIGGLLAGTSDRDIVVCRLLPMSFAAMGLALLVLSESRVEATILLLLALLGAADATTEVSYSTLLQRHITPDRLAAVLALGSSGVNTGMVLGFASSALLAHVTSPAAAVQAAAAGCFAGALIAILATLPASQRTIMRRPHWPASLPRRVDIERVAHDDLMELANACGLAQTLGEATLRQQLQTLRAASSASG
jgi:predicted MFS family arabinose efflux permease